MEISGKSKLQSVEKYSFTTSPQLGYINNNNNNNSTNNWRRPHQTICQTRLTVVLFFKNRSTVVETETRN